ncbi:RNA polymerase primary sigma factor/RNA polymerase nonessential primary-like sigma factor [Prauserella sediminis]|uniref:RNA polymerase primary sigma factor/RNA polymerase nonessential primary-like sigma factor n=1 Tax=Prauserella sediminis TaxID=577680 RepID=A0A839XQV5_9PSEU|nr:sigma-70 family RNA polymerase sigma factor [Prauserella sediminis]MBB3665111.1 RNA polymerase primary sigma factor/RNA polymerase nonessential primary-like sigma factor [Prauserella sediminis]
MAEATKTPTRRTRATGSGEADADLVRVYLDEIGRTPLLTAEQEIDLAKRIEAGVYATELLRRADRARDGRDDTGSHQAGHDGSAAPMLPSGAAELPADRRDLEQIARDGEAAKDHMVQANLRLVVTAARKNRNSNLSLLDAVQEGNLGLIHAVEKFDYAKGFKFSTYAMWWIRQAIQRGNAFFSGTIRLPMHTAEQIAKLDRLQRTLEAQGRHNLSVDELAQAADMSVERVLALRQAGQSTASLDVPVDDDGELTLGDLVTTGSVPGVSESLEHSSMVGELNAALETLPAQEATVLALRYGLTDGDPHTVPDIARRLGLTRKRVRSLEERGLSRLRAENHGSLLAWAS